MKNGEHAECTVTLHRMAGAVVRQKISCIVLSVYLGIVLGRYKYDSCLAGEVQRIDTEKARYQVKQKARKAIRLPCGEVRAPSSDSGNPFSTVGNKGTGESTYSLFRFAAYGLFLRLVSGAL